MPAPRVTGERVEAMTGLFEALLDEWMEMGATLDGDMAPDAEVLAQVDALRVAGRDAWREKWRVASTLISSEAP